MSENLEENDSDIEILDSGVLRTSYFRQQLRLIYELDQCGKRIPRSFPEFQVFIKKNIEWHPSADLIHSTWLKLNCAEQEFGGAKAQPVVEISDDEGLSEQSTIYIIDPPSLEQSKNKPRRKKQIRKQNKNNNKSESLKGGIIEAPLSPDVLIIENPSSSSSVVTGEPSSSSSVFAGEPSSSTSLLEATDEKMCINNVNSKKKKSSFKKNSNNKTPKKRKSIESASMTEAEAELLRQKLLIDKIIELELPNVIKSVMQETTLSDEISPKFVSNLMKKTQRKRRKLN